MPFGQHPRPATGLSIVARTAEPAALADALRRTARALNAEVPVKFSTLEAKLAESVASPRFRTLLLGVFAALAVALAMAGVYGVMAYMVTRRSAEIGVRMALGARPHDVLALVMGHGARLAALGLALGVAGSLAAAGILKTFLYQVSATDPMTYFRITLGLAAVALAAGWLPARRAMRTDPLTALREE